MGLIYMRISPSGGKYIGKTMYLEEHRWKEHVKEAYNKNSPRYNDLINKAIRKYGPDNFDVIILEDNLTIDELNAREQYWIKTEKTYYLENQHGYNMTYGGDGAIKYNSNNFKQLWLKGYNCKEIANIYNCQPNTVSLHLQASGISKEDIAARQAELAKIQNTTIRQYADEIISKWKQGMSQIQLSKEYNCSYTTIKSILHNCLDITNEEFFKHRSISNLNNSNCKIILQFDLKDNFIKEWPSMTDAAKALNTSTSVISRACSGQRKTAKGFKWKYKGE